MNQDLFKSVVQFESAVSLFRIERKATPCMKWCIAIKIEADNVYLYMSEESEGAFRFKALGSDMSNVVYYTNKRCLQMVDFINQQRSANGLSDKAFAYNPFTGVIGK